MIIDIMVIYSIIFYSMLNKMTAKDARDNFSDLLGAVYYGRKLVAVEKKGRIFAIVINPEEYQTLKKATKTRFFELVDNVQKSNKTKTAPEVMKDITSAVEQVRGKRYANSE